MSVDHELMRRIAAAEPTVAVEEHFGPEGLAPMRQLTRGLELIGQQLAYELLEKGLTVFATFDPEVRPLTELGSAEVRAEQLPGLVKTVASIQVLEDGFIASDGTPDLASLSVDAVVYRFDGQDNLVFDGELWPVENPTAFQSRWRTPTFFDLADALRHYQDAVAPTSRCPYLSKAWYDPERRWILINRPEKTLQDSLAQHLVSSLRLGQVELRREQPVGEEKPPDIKVTWSQTNRLALIEVKWIGASVDRDGTRISWEPAEREANEGATQLVGYLQLNAQESPQHQTMGFLVVFDARRAELSFESTELTAEQALYYSTRDVAWDPDFAAERHDFHPPLRCFMHPLKP
jgi:hypothetical protein